MPVKPSDAKGRARQSRCLPGRLSGRLCLLAVSLLFVALVTLILALREGGASPMAWLPEFLAGMAVAAVLSIVLWGRGRAAEAIEATPDERPEENGQAPPAAPDRPATRFLAAAGHDLRQPLQALKLLTAVLDHTDDADQRREIVANMGDTLRIMENVLGALIDVSNLDVGSVSPEVTDLAVDEILSRTAAAFQPRAEEKGMDLRVVPSRAMVRSDEKWLERIVESFLSNAVEHSGSGKVLLGCRRRGDNLRIEVRDGGQGIARDHFDRIFEEFYQIGTPDRDQHRGLGLGLAIAKRAADMLDHRIEAASHPGQGSMFAVEVPLAARSADAPLPSMSAPRYDDATL